MSNRYQFKGKLKSKARAIRQTGRPLQEQPRQQYKRKGDDVYQSPRWIKLSAQLKREITACELCGDKDSKLSVNHKIALFEMADPINDPRAFDRNNLEVLCAKCHGKADHLRRQEVKRQKLEDSLDWLKDEQ